MRYFVEANKRISRWFDSFFPTEMRQDGNGHFRNVVAPSLYSEGMILYDLGGGSQPILSIEDKERLGARVIGLDIESNELTAAPPGSYDVTIVADLTMFRAAADGDLAICQATLEHVKDTDGAIKAIASTLRYGGRAAIFAPCRNAAFARLNLLLPQSIKMRILGAVFPSKAEGHDGFPAFYNKCTPNDLAAMAVKHGLEVEEIRTYWTSSYFSVLFPVFVAWRMWTILGRYFIGRQTCETFAMVLRKV